MNWKRVYQNSLPDLRVLVIKGQEVGFIYKPVDSQSDKNAWRIHKGIGDNNQFLGHRWTKDQAQWFLEEQFNK